MENPKKEEFQPDVVSEIMFKKHHHSLALTIGITIATIGTFSTLGYFADIYFKTDPAFLITAIVIGFPVTQGLIYVALKKHALKKLNNYKNGKQ
jgi:F0F1-type ATP synthase assembly protein I